MGAKGQIPSSALDGPAGVLLVVLAAVLSAPGAMARAWRQRRNEQQTDTQSRERT